MPQQLTTLEDKVNYTLQRYGSQSDFIQTFHLDNMPRYVRNPVRCVCGTAPSLMTVSKAYGEKMTIQWLMTLFIGASEFSGAKSKITPYQLTKLANKFFDRCNDLKVTEVMLFIDKLESGDFGRFSWQTFDPVAVLEKIDSFRQYAERVVQRERQRIDDIQAEKDRQQAVPCPPEIAERLKSLYANLASNSKQKDSQPSWLEKLATHNESTQDINHD